MRSLLILSGTFRFGLLFFIGISLSACLSTGGSVEKIGMHIDAALEFAVEHPMSWQKDRRLPYGSNQGEVRWTQTSHPEMMLLIRSEPAANQTQTVDERISMIQRQYPGMVLTLKEEADIPAGKALHIMAYNAQHNFDIYLINSANRHYSIIFTATADTMGAFSSIIKEIIESFMILSYSNSMSA